MRFVVLSDLHLSRYGGTNEPRAHGGRPYLIKVDGVAKDRGVFWKTIEELYGWRIQRHRLDLHWRVLDPDRIRRCTDHVDLEAIRRQVGAWIRADALELRKRPPGAEELLRLLEIDPQNTNLRLLQVAQMLRQRGLFDAVLVVAGDITDNGYGHYLLDEAFHEWFESGRVVIAPGNHDLNKVLVSPLGFQFEMEPGTTTRAEKQKGFWGWFRHATGRQPFGDGCAEPVDGGDGVHFIALDSIANVSTRGLFEAAANAIGEVSEHAIAGAVDAVRRVRNRDPSARVVVVQHHHVLWRGLAPVDFTEGYMSVGNAEQEWRALSAAGVDLIVSGHRHCSYFRDDLGTGSPALLSSPSTTLGDSRGAERFVYLVSMSRDARTTVEKLGIP